MPKRRLGRVEGSVKEAIHQDESFLLLLRRQHKWLGANELHHVLSGAPQVQVEAKWGVAHYGSAREHLAARSSAANRVLTSSPPWYTLEDPILI